MELLVGEKGNFVITIPDGIVSEKDEYYTTIASRGLEVTCWNEQPTRAPANDSWEGTQFIATPSADLLGERGANVAGWAQAFLDSNFGKRWSGEHLGHLIADVKALIKVSLPTVPPPDPLLGERETASPAGEVPGKPNTLYHVICRAVEAESKRLGENEWSVSLAGTVHDAVQKHLFSMPDPLLPELERKKIGIVAARQVVEAIQDRIDEITKELEQGEKQ